VHCSKTQRFVRCDGSQSKINAGTTMSAVECSE
jgi:hypothetical protein